MTKSNPVINYNQWKENIFLSIKDLSDFQFQKESWLGKSNQFVSSFSEDVSMLYDSFCFSDDFWEEEHLNKFEFSSKLLEELKILKKMIDSYERKPTDEAIVADPKWYEIVKQAQKVVDNWNT